MHRRTFLRSTALGLAGAAVLGGCSDDDTATGDGESSGLGTLRYQLAWVKNVEFAGMYIADQRGYYGDEGFSAVDLMAGGPDVQPDAVVQTGKAFVGVSSPDLTAAANAEGATLVVLGAQYQKSPFGIMSLADTPIGSPGEMVGKRIGIQPVNDPIWHAFLTVNDLDPASIETIPVQVGNEELVNRDIDGVLSFVTADPFLLQVQGIATVNILLHDHGYPMVSEVIVVKRDTLARQRDRVRAVLRADIRGWRDSVRDPALGAQLAVEEYGSSLGLDEAEQILESTKQNELLLTDDTRANGLFTITDELLEQTIASLGVSGTRTTAAELFDLSLLEEIYADEPDLKASPI